jgi:hypothetical protein
MLRTSLRRRLRIVVLGVAALAGLNGVAHGFGQRPWAVEDEVQHVDAAIKLSEARLAHLDDPIELSVAESVLATERSVPAPGTVTADPPSWGLVGRSYLAYHPPGGPAVLAPFAMALGGDGFRTMVAGRALAALLVAVATAGVASIAASFHPARPVKAALLAGLTFAALPAVGDLGGRWSNDVVVLVAVVGAVAAGISVGRDPTRRSLALLSVAITVAVATKVSGLAALAGLVPALAHPGARPSGRAVALVLAAPAAVTLGWALVLDGRYGTVDGVTAFLDRYGAPFATGSILGSDAPTLLRRSFLPFDPDAWGVTVLVPVALVAVIVLGLVWRRPRSGAPLLTVAAVGVACLVVLERGRQTGLLTPSARFVAPLVAVAVAVAAGGWARMAAHPTRWPLAWIGPTLSVSLGAWFLLAHRTPW